MPGKRATKTAAKTTKTKPAAKTTIAAKVAPAKKVAVKAKAKVAPAKVKAAPVKAKVALAKSPKTKKPAAAASSSGGTAFVALLRAINVGGTGKLAMADLRVLCEGCGFGEVATYIQSGNVVFRSAKSEAQVKQILEAALEKKMGKPYGAIVRSGAELARVAQEPPFPHAAPNQLLVMFFDEAPAQAAVDAVTPPGGEELELRGRELYVHFPMGAGDSKLRLPFAKVATARNLNTVRALTEMAAKL